ncbi:hypothetical protein HY972_02620 [Candidatus Kaiserbacteria bacterium]|nr:hypothetical protein [Candidatus Kaiserbacteria bacterium]
MVLVGLLVAWMLISVWRGYAESMPPREYRLKRALFLIGGILLALAYALIFRNECIVIPLSVILAGLLAWLAWIRYSRDPE